jgi:hypothetical protein
VGPTVGFETIEKINISCLLQESNTDFMAIQTVARRILIEVNVTVSTKTASFTEMQTCVHIGILIPKDEEFNIISKTCIDLL